MSRLTGKQHWPSTSLWLYLSLTKQYFISHCNYTFWNRKATVHCSLLPPYPCSANLADSKHQSHCLSTGFKLIWSKLLLLIFSLQKLNTKHYQCRCQDVSIADCVALISTGMRLLLSTHPTRTIFVAPINHAFIDAWYSTWSIVFHVVVVEIINHSAHIKCNHCAVVVVDWWIRELTLCHQIDIQKFIHLDNQEHLGSIQ